MTDPAAKVGVLLVHGIGEHRQGDTLSAVGAPIIDWLQEWLACPLGQGIRGQLTWTEAYLPPSDDGQGPAHARVEVAARDEIGAQTQRESLIFCEAHWGESVRPPEPLKLMRWLWTRGPLLIYWHFHVLLASSKKRVSGDRRSLYFSTALLLAGLVQVTVGVGLLLAIIPVGAWRQGVLSVIRRLTLTLGDSYVLLEHELQHTVLKQRVAEALSWLSGRVERVVVLAHSQGAAIAHDVLAAKPGPEKVVGLITLGSGLEKLQLLKTVQRSGAVVTWAALVFPLAATSITLLYRGFEAARAGGQVVRWEVSLALVLGLVAWTCSLALRVELERLLETTRATVEDKLALHGGLVWCDFYTDHDIVSMGRSSPLLEAQLAKSFAVKNEGSFIKDHTGYLASPAGALPQIWKILGELSGLTLFHEGDLERLKQLRAAHDRDVEMLTYARFSVIVAAVGGLLSIQDRVLLLGRTLVDAANDKKLEAVLKPVATLADITTWLSQHLFAIADERAKQVAFAVVGASVPLLALLLWWGVVRGGVMAVGQRRFRRATRTPQPLREASSKLRAFPARALRFGVASVPLVVFLVLSTKAVTGTMLGNVLGNVLALGFFLAGAAALLGGPWLWKKAAVREKSQAERAILAILPAFVAVFALKAAIDLGPFTVSGNAEDNFAPFLGFFLHALAWQVFVLAQSRNEYRSSVTATLLLVPALAAAAGVASPALFALLKSAMAPLYSTFAAFANVYALTTFALLVLFAGARNRELLWKGLQRRLPRKW